MADPHNALTSSILIVDDTPINLQLLSTMLTQRGFRARPVTSAKAALAAAEAEHPDLVLMDVSMPEMNGYEACERFKANPLLKDIPIIFLSALGQTEDKVRAFRAGAVDYITKPFLIEEIDARINAHLREVRHQREIMRHKQLLEETVALRTQDLNTAYLTLKQMDRTKGEFLIMLAHELRTPSNGLLGISELILQACPDTVEMKELRGAYEKSRDRMVSLIDDCEYLESLENRKNTEHPPCCAMSEALALANTHLGVAFPPDPVAPDAQIPASAEELGQLFRRVAAIVNLFNDGERFGLSTARVRPQGLIIQLEITRLVLDKAQCAQFFAAGSAVRTTSKVESLGLSPIVVAKLAALAGGSVTLMPKDHDEGGEVILSLPWF